MNDFGFYGILTNPARGYEYVCAAMIDCGVRYIQLRMKDVEEGQFLATAEKLRKLFASSSSRFIINDNARIARLVDADGVHLGQSDAALAEVRNIIGSQKLLGLSTHNVSQTIHAKKQSPDYIGIGPVYPTPTKKNPDPVIGLDGMQKMLQAAVVPAVCIGGITLENLEQVLENGAKNVCLVREVCAAEQPTKIIKKIISTLERF